MKPLILHPNPVPRVAELPTIDPRNAAALVLRDYLASLEFRRWGGDAPDTLFKLRHVHEEWPEPSVELDYPVASIVDSGNTPMDAHALVPTCLEETRDVFGEGTVLWKLAEASIMFQIDFFTDDAPTREAIAAALPSAFNPDIDERAGVILRGSCHYYDRSIRATLEGFRRMDYEGSIYPRERRLMTQVRCDLDVVSLRCYTVFSPRVNVVAVGPEVVVGKNQTP